MRITSNEEIYSMVRSFENRTIAKSDWTHTVHLIVGLHYCRTLPFSVAKNMMRDGICWLNGKHGTPNTDLSGYHETLTVFWLMRIWNLLDDRAASGSLVSIANEMIDRNADPALPLTYYSPEVLYSATARRDYLPPDRRIQRPISLAFTLHSLKLLL